MPLGIALGIVAGTLAWSLAYVSNALPSDPGFAAVSWVPFALLFGFISWVLLSLTSRTRRYRSSAIARLRLALPAAGLGAAILGVALSFACGPTSCDVHPLWPYGVVLSAIGLFVFLAGLTLAAAFPPEGPSVS